MEIPSLLLLSFIGLLGLLCQWLAWRVKLPAILFLLLTGILLGPVSGVLDPDALFGDLLFSFISLSVAIILFEGSLTLKRSELSEVGSVVKNLVTYGALLNGLIVTVCTHYLTGISWSLSALFGAIMVVTGPTVIMPMLRTVRPNAVLARTLRWEGIVIDPLGALLAVLVFEWIVAHQIGTNLLHVFSIFGQTIAVGSILGAAVAYSYGLLLRHRFIPLYLHNFSAIVVVTSTFAVSNILMHESGLLAVTIMGIWLANMRGVDTRDILNFKENLTLMLVSTLFIVLSARLEFDGLITLAWVGPRGIVAAAITAVFALKLELMNIPHAELLVPLAFSVIIGTVVIQSATARYLTVKLGVNAPDVKGYLVIGANPVAIAVAKALQEAKIETVVCDSDWSNISAARMAGLKTYYGNALSDHAEMHLDMTTLGGIVGLSRNHAVNSAAALRFREDFGPRKIFVLPELYHQKEHSKHHASELYSGRVVLGSDWSYQKLYRLVNGHETLTKSTLLTEEYLYSQWLENNDMETVVPLFALDESGNLFWFTADEALQPKPGWKLFSLSAPTEELAAG